MGKKSKFKNLGSGLKDFNVPDIYTFIDASINKNVYSGTTTGVYGFVHFKRLTPFQTIQPFASGFKVARDCTIHELEANAFYSAIKSIKNHFKHPKEIEFCIVMDSDYVFYRLINWFKDDLKWTSKKNNDATKIMIECCEMFGKKKHKNHNVVLCKSHTISNSDQFEYLKAKGMLSENQSQFATDIRIGNEYIDYCVSRMAKHENPSVLNQYNGYEDLYDKMDDYDSMFNNIDDHPLVCK